MGDIEAGPALNEAQTPLPAGVGGQDDAVGIERQPRSVDQHDIADLANRRGKARFAIGSGNRVGRRALRGLLVFRPDGPADGQREDHRCRQGHAETGMDPAGRPVAGRGGLGAAAEPLVRLKVSATLL
jgi:hypothetical protein